MKVVDESKGGPAPLLRPTEQGARLGRPRYWSPEQVLGEPVDARSDIYQVGAMLYEMLSARSPVEPWHGAELADAHAHFTAPRLGGIVDEPLPAGLERAIHRALAKKPGERFDSARELAALLRAIATEARLGAVPTEPLPRARAAVAEPAAAGAGAGQLVERDALGQAEAASPSAPEHPVSEPPARQRRTSPRQLRLALLALALTAVAVVLGLWRWLS